MSKRKIKPYTHYTADEDQFIRDNFIQFNFHELARRMGRSKCGIISRIKTLGLVLPDEIKKQRIEKARFKKGHVPANKGKKGWCAPGCEITWFKKGHKPENTKYDGAITIRQPHKDRGASPYLYIRVKESRWVPLHQHIWRSAGKKIPHNHIVVFKDGNSIDWESKVSKYSYKKLYDFLISRCKLENLELISRQENLRRNHNAKKAAITRMNSPEGIAAYLSYGDKNLQKELVENHPELIELKRKQLELKRNLKYATT